MAYYFVFCGLYGFSGTVGATTLNNSQNAQHNHIFAQQVRTQTGSVAFVGGTGGDMGFISSTENAGGSQAHIHTLSGASGKASSLPPYYVLAYIMRCA